MDGGGTLQVGPRWMDELFRQLLLGGWMEELFG